MGNVDASASASSIGLTWGGKLPCMGDFVWSEDPTVLRNRLDNWLLTGMQQFRSTFSDSWQSSFDQAPIWNFIVPAHVLGSGCVAGCISPSCDRIGRRFPFVVAYGLAADTPSWYLSKAIDSIPGLLSRTGILLFNGIRRQWHREALATLFHQALTDWKGASLPVEHTGLGVPHADSLILSVLAGEDGNGNNRANSSNPDDMVTMPNDRYSSLPWIDATNSLIAGAATSFWWTNGAGGATLKAFTYGPHLDGTLMTWLFGRSSM